MNTKKIISVLLALMTCFSLMAQDFIVQGTVTSSTDGTSLIGVGVIVKGNTSNGTVTNIDGKYSIQLQNSDAVLVFSSIGFKTQEIKLNQGQKLLNVVMEEDVNLLDDVVVIGYGTTKKALLTGANLNVKGADITKLNTSTALEALEGTAAGVSITRNNGSPGAGTKVNIRGMGTIGDSDPLYIVDGVTVDNIDYLSPSDIESIDILKDAASSAIYGSRAANGVILVTTKKGSIDTKPVITYDGYFGIQNYYKQPELLNAQEYMMMYDEARANTGQSPLNWKTDILENNGWLESQKSGLGTAYGDYLWNKLENGWEGTNWIDEITQENAPVQSHSVGIRGGSEDIIYSLGASYYDQTGLIGGNLSDAGFRRFTGRMNTTIILIKNHSRNILKIGENLTYTNSKNKKVATGNKYYNDLHFALVSNPLGDVYWDDSLDPNNFAPTVDGMNPEHMNCVARMEYQRKYQWTGNNKIIGNVFAELSPIKDLVIRSSYAVNAWWGNYRGYSPIYALGVRTNNSSDSVNQSQWQGSTATWTNTVNYKHTFAEDHHFEFLIGTEFTDNVVNSTVSGSKNNSIFEDAQHAYLDNVPKVSVTDISTSGNDYAAEGGGLMSYMSRISYNYKSKYMFDATIRADGSSNFAEGHRWGYFPSVAAGWVLTDEPFIKNLGFFEYGKIRASWGQNGNQSISNFIYTSNISYDALGYYFGSDKTTSASTAYPSNVPNEDVSWETSEQLNFGLDASFLKSRLTLNLDWYKKTTKDWLVDAPIQGTSGASAPYINGGNIENKGIEVIVGWNDHSEDFTYSAKVSFFQNHNEVTKLANAEGIINGAAGPLVENASFISRVEVGFPIGYFYGYKTDGILQNQADVDAYVNDAGEPYFDDQRPGDLKFVDLNNDGIIDETDKTKIGDPNPNFQLGLQLNAEYKGIYASMTMSGKFGMQVANSYFWGDPAEQNYTTDVFNRWHGEGTSNKIPYLSTSSNRNTRYMSDAYIYDANFLRITNLTIGYDFKNLISRVPYISGAKVYCSVTNLYTFTNYNGLDPDVAYGGDTSWASGIDVGLYPLPRTVMFGVNLTF